MKMKSLFILVLLSSLTLVSCNPAGTSISTSGTSSDGGSASGGGDNGNGSGGNTGGGNTGGGNTGGGGSDKLPLRTFPLLLAGGQEWKPWSSGDGISDMGKSSLPSIQDQLLLLASDSKLEMRVKLKPQPFNDALADNNNFVPNCYGEVSGSGDSILYNKISFRVSLREVFSCSGSDSNNCTVASYPYYSTSVSPVSVDSFSQVLELGSKRKLNAYGTIVEINTVLADNTCFGSPGEDQRCGEGESYGPLRAQSCWEAEIQFATDYTDSF